MLHALIVVLTGAAVWAWIVGHQLAIYYVFSVLIEQLPPPDNTSGKFYRYVYSVIQVLAANLQRTKDAISIKTPAPPPPPAPPKP